MQKERMEHTYIPKDSDSDSDSDKDNDESG